MDELDVFHSMREIVGQSEGCLSGNMPEWEKKLIQHKLWLSHVPRERPSTQTPYRVGVYIRFFNQTRYDNYLDYHKQQFSALLQGCPNWSLVDFYVDFGAVPPTMERAPGWRRLLDDCIQGNVNLILTQKLSNLSKRVFELTFCSRLLAAQDPPVGIYFISEDIFTLASYYQEDLRDTFFLSTQNPRSAIAKGAEALPYDEQ